MRRVRQFLLFARERQAADALLIYRYQYRRAKDSTDLTVTTNAAAASNGRALLSRLRKASSRFLITA